jgi:hypothetical protein
MRHGGERKKTLKELGFEIRQLLLRRDNSPTFRVEGAGRYKRTHTQFDDIWGGELKRLFWELIETVTSTPVKTPKRTKYVLPKTEHLKKGNIPTVAPIERAELSRRATRMNAAMHEDAYKMQKLPIRKRFYMALENMLTVNRSRKRF